MSKIIEYVYFYTQRKFATPHKEYEVIKVQVFNSIDEAERKARTIAENLGTKLAGGYFVENAKPYNLETYNIVECLKNTKIQPYNKQDLFIHALIETESNMEYEII